MKYILYTAILFATAVYAKAQSLVTGNILLVYYKCKMNDRSNLEDLIFKADSISRYDKNRLILYKNNKLIDTLYIKDSLKYSRGVYLHLQGNDIFLKSGYNSSRIKKFLLYDKEALKCIQRFSSTYRPNADHSSHASHYSHYSAIK